MGKLDRRTLLQTDCVQLTESQAMSIEKNLFPGSSRRPASSTVEDVQAYSRGGGCHFESLMPEIQLAIAEQIMCQHAENQVLAVQNTADQLYFTSSSLVSGSRLPPSSHAEYLASVRSHIEAF
ncbi:MAG: hypothetical protein U0V70_21605 [Terriglobia bacterium]